MQAELAAMDTVLSNVPSTPHFPLPERAPETPRAVEVPPSGEPLRRDGVEAGDASIGAAAAERAPQSFTEKLLAEHETLSIPREAGRALIGLGLASIYGVALGARSGGVAFARHALGVPAAIAAIAALGVPALYIALALFDTPLSSHKAISSASRAVASAGMVLAGLAPAAALFVVSSAGAGPAAVVAALGLALAGAVGLVRLIRELNDALEDAEALKRSWAHLIFAGFTVFSIALAYRVWMSLLPVLGGAK